MKRSAAFLALLAAGWSAPALQARAQGVNAIDTVVVIYAENRSFDNLYGSFPGANGLQNVTPENSTQVDRDGTVFKELPPVWDGLTAKGVTPPVTASADRASAQQAVRHRRSERLQHAAQRRHPRSLAPLLSEPDADRWRQERPLRGLRGFRRAGDGPLLTAASCRCGRSPSNTRSPTISSMGAFGGSFLNHFELICACAPVYPDADKSPAKKHIAVVDPDKVTLTLAANSPKSARGRHSEIRRGRRHHA